MDSTAGFWRVYKDEWTVVYVSDTDGEKGTLECVQKFLSVYEGRVQSGDWRVVAWSSSDPDGWPVMLEVHLPVMKGEYRDRKDAGACAAEIDGTAVLENSREELDMLRRAGGMSRDG